MDVLKLWVLIRLGGGYRMTNREDDVLLDIDRLVDESLSRRDQSDDYHGRGWRTEHPCPWCSEGWHFLPITEHMARMRGGSYATDEFGIGIMDPDYKYQDDTSAVLCPGSEYHGPEHFTKQWDKQRRERIAARSDRTTRRSYQAPVSPSLPPGRRRKLRFVGPFQPWTIALDDEREIEDIIPGPNLFGVPGWPEDPYQRVPIVRSQRLTATFTLDSLIKNPSQEWVVQNEQDIAHMRFTSEGALVEMKDIVIPFAGFEVYARDPQGTYPDWVEFDTTYEIERHPWFMHFWMVSGTADNPTLRPAHPVPPPDELNFLPDGSPNRRPHQGHEPDIVIMDEAYEVGDEEIEDYVNQVQAVTRHLAETAGIPPGYLVEWTTAETPDEDERRPPILRRRAEAAEGWVRQVAARAQAGQVQGAPGPADPPSEEEAMETGAERSDSHDARRHQS